MSKGKTKMKCMVPMQVLSLVLGGSTDSSVAEPIFVLFFGDDHGEEAVVGRRDSNLASGGSAVPNSLVIVCCVGVVGAVADRNPPALGGSSRSVRGRVGNSTYATWE